MQFAFSVNYLPLGNPQDLRRQTSLGCLDLLSYPLTIWLQLGEDRT
jgi:hypothetical protein